MPYELIRFADPLDKVKGTLVLDNGTVLNSHPATHPTGRKGLGFTIPDGSPQGNGVKIQFNAEGFTPVVFRAILYLNDGILIYPFTTGQEAALDIDDFHLQPLPPPVIVHPEPEPGTGNQPIDIINAVWATGKHELKTKEGCGKFTEACCTALHVKHSNLWGHIKKSGPQNQYNGHAVDSVMLLVNVIKDEKVTKAGIYDIILESESDIAKPAFNLKDEVNANLWYYPAL